ncbi:MAG: 50S ribosomal protein L18 [Candidatus Diapherotrites archaeon]|nr:50S ribosomal protein L18 [Candidatus Diapherotrites archaeon]
MAHKSTYKTLFKRRRSGKTNYVKRVSMLSSKNLRLVVRKSSALIRCQVVAYETKGDQTIASAVSSELTKWGWNANPKNLPSAYLTGLLLGKRAVKANVKKVVVDIGLHTAMHKGRLFAAIKGAIDAGLTVPVSETVLPDANRVAGKHVEAFAQKPSAKDPHQFDKVRKQGFDPARTSAMFAQAKQAIEQDPFKGTKTK